MSKHVYKQAFFDYLDVSSSQSAQEFLARLDIGVPITSVLDVGCGRGPWLAEWQKWGIGDVFGVDGHYVDTASLLIPAEKFSHHNLAEPLDLGRKFDLAQCLEVAEHLDEKHASVLLDSIARHADLVLFSAATPGQGGEHHVNERPPEYWADSFATRGYRCFDYMRDRVREHKSIEPWYRYNTMLFARGEVLDRLPARVTETERKPGEPLKKVAPLPWRMRNSVIGMLPGWAVNMLAKLKHYLRTRK